MEKLFNEFIYFENRECLLYDRTSTQRQDIDYWNQKKKLQPNLPLQMHIHQSPTYIIQVDMYNICLITINIFKIFVYCILF